MELRPQGARHIAVRNSTHDSDISADGREVVVGHAARLESTSERGAGGVLDSERHTLPVDAMNPPSTTCCPRCGFSFAWDGRVCGHCPLTDRALQLWSNGAEPLNWDRSRGVWEQIKRFHEVVESGRTISRYKLLAIAAGCLRRAWHALPQSARLAVELLERGATQERLAAAARSVAEDPLILPEAAQVARNVADVVLGRGHVDLLWAVRSVAEECRRVVGLCAFPPRELCSFPLPTELEPHRAAAGLWWYYRDVGSGSQQAVLNRIRLARSGIHQTCVDILAPKPSDREAVAAAHRQLSSQLTEYDLQRSRVMAAEEPVQCDIARDVLGYTGGPITFGPSWRTSTAIALARGMCESGDFFAMPILADALEDAGCDSEDVLTHCRDPKQTHVRGCWVIRRVLGEE